ncbi:RNA-directed DNA polymerase, eukaryota [Tanacetum coccineum]
MDDNEWHEVTRKKSNSVFQRLRFPPSVSNRYPSKEDQAHKISKSVFVTNFPDHFSARDLWNVCVAYGKVIDVFIPFKRSKTGKKFAFVRFIRMDNMERLIENLSTIWIVKFCLHANVVRFKRDPKPTDSQSKINVPHPNKSFVAPVKNMGTENRSFASVLNVGNGISNKATESTPAIVLDDDCLIKRDFSCSLMGKIKDLNAIPNLYLILSNEGFENVKISHLGGLWVLLNMDSVVAKEKVRKHVGLPPKAMTHNTFAKIVSIWGDLMNVEDSECISLSYKRLCVKIKAKVTINDTIKVIVNGKLFWIRVKELEPWYPNFKDEKDDNSSSGEESIENDLENNNENLMKDFELDNENEIDHVSESSYMNENDLVFKQVSKSPVNPSMSADPFNIYSLLKKNKEEVVMENNMNNVTSDKSDPQFPPGFTPDVEKNNEEEVNPAKEVLPKDKGVAYDVNESIGVSSIKSGGSLLDIMDELIKVGHAMGYNMDGCLGQKAKKGWIQELNSKHRVSFVALQETKMESIDLFSIKALWGNFAFDYVLSPSVGFSGGILCAWDPNLFHKDNSTVSDSFVALRGLVDLPMEGYSYTWAHKTASKMSKLDRFLISEEETSISQNFDQKWLSEEKLRSNSTKMVIQNRLSDLDKIIDLGNGNEELVNERSKLLHELFDLNSKTSFDLLQKAKIRWVIEGDENSKYFHRIINKKRSQLAIRGVLAEGEWIVDPSNVK